MSHAYRYCQGPVRTRSGPLYEIFHHAPGAPVLSVQGDTPESAWQALGQRVDHADPDWRASAHLVEALNLPAARLGRPDALQRDTALALAANAHGGAAFAAIPESDVRAACLSSFAHLVELSAKLDGGEPVLYDMRSAGSVLRAGVAVLVAEAGATTLAVVDDRDAAQRYLHARHRGCENAAPAFDAVTVRPSSGWFALAMRDALGVGFDLDLVRRRSGSTAPMPSSGAVILGAVARGLPDRPLSQPNGTGALATRGLQTVCMLTRLPGAPRAPQGRPTRLRYQALRVLPGE
ncbi:hypothetical protein [Citreimonas salinaria]|uniref:Uncharacterized protein n=1 Tax=Citreimonas salinaria TaxID=321339 RepID=A0A1H3H810_9RHOB|nr:hypothetical protein [Citreimonas salinaria]SDY10914.1 hypothetical protein SAMN05444340_103252 [Citreimonas salinaria]